MSNMSYCRFQNTLRDLTDCREALEELLAGQAEPLSAEELRAATSLAQECVGIVQLLEEHSDGPFDDDIDRQIASTLAEANDECDEDALDGAHDIDDDDAVLDLRTVRVAVSPNEEGAEETWRGSLLDFFASNSIDDYRDRLAILDALRSVGVHHLGGGAAPASVVQLLS